MASTKPIICLVHGAWHHPLYYRNLIDPLRSKGYTVLAPINATVGIDDSIAGKTYVDDVKRIHETLLPQLDIGKEAVLVCHSYGGVPGTAALQGQTINERAARRLAGGVKTVLYFAAVAIPQRGMSLFSLENEEWPTWHKQDGELRLLKPEAADVLYNDIPVQDRQQYMSGLMYQSNASLVTGADYAATEVKIPKTYVVCSEDKCIPAPGQRAMANAMGAEIVEFECGHSPFMKEDESKELVKLILAIAALQ